MSKVQRFNTFLGGLITLFFGIMLFAFPGDGLKVIASSICLSLIISGVNKLIYYATMARHMVGGRNALISGLVITDLGVYFFTMQDFPQAYIIIYLLIILAFSGVVDIMGALDAWRSDSKSWRIKMATGIGNLALAVCAVVFGFAKGDVQTVTYIYAFGICYSGVMRMVKAFRRTAVAYIQ